MCACNVESSRSDHDVLTPQDLELRIDIWNDVLRLKGYTVKRCLCLLKQNICWLCHNARNLGPCRAILRLRIVKSHDLWSLPYETPYLIVWKHANSQCAMLYYATLTVLFSKCSRLPWLRRMFFAPKSALSFRMKNRRLSARRYTRHQHEQDVPPGFPSHSREV